MDRSAQPGISIHLVGLPRMLQDAVGRLLTSHGLTSSVGPPPAAAASAVTVLVMQSGLDPAHWMEQLRRRPDASILLVEPRECRVELVELWPARRPQGVLDANSIGAALRSATSWARRSTAACEPPTAIASST